MKDDSTGEQTPRILVFSTNTISDPGIDLAGSSHMHYPTSVVVLQVPCSSGVKPEWVVHALEVGFEGVFLAADGTDCPYLADCTARTARVTEDAQSLADERGILKQRIRMAAVCSVCAESFASHMEKFAKTLTELRAEAA